jgi:hypothetical protein
MPDQRVRSAVAIAFSLSTSLLPHPAAAQTANDAEALFNKGLESMRARDYASACPAIEKSYQLDPLPGVLFTLAECDAAWGKLSAASTRYQTFLDALTSLPPGRRDTFEERRRIALDKLATVSAVMPEITIDVARDAPAELVVKRNGAALERSSYGVTQKVDPGEYVVTATAPDGHTWEHRVKLEAHSAARVEVPWPLIAPELPAELAQPDAVGPPRGQAPDARGAGLRPWAYVAGGVGVIGLTTGIVAGLVALGDKSTIDANCPNRLCNAEGQRAVDSARSSATISTIAFPVGLAGAGVSAVLFMMSSRVTPSVGLAPGAASVSVQGAF